MSVCLDSAREAGIRFGLRVRTLLYKPNFKWFQASGASEKTLVTDLCVCSDSAREAGIRFGLRVRILL